MHRYLFLYLKSMLFLSFFSGTPVYFSASLIEMSDWGGMDATLLRKALAIFWGIKEVFHWKITNISIKSLAVLQMVQVLTLGEIPV